MLFVDFCLQNEILRFFRSSVYFEKTDFFEKIGFKTWLWIVDFGVFFVFFGCVVLNCKLFIYFIFSWLIFVFSTKRVV